MVSVTIKSVAIDFPGHVGDIELTKGFVPGTTHNQARPGPNTIGVGEFSRAISPGVDINQILPVDRLIIVRGKKTGLDPGLENPVRKSFPVP